MRKSHAMARKPNKLHDEGLTIGQLANQAGVNVETIRYYQRIGLLEEPPKPSQGYRIYPASAIARIRFVKRAQKLGFSLSEIAELLSLHDNDCVEVCVIAEHKLEVIQHRINDLHAIQAELEKLIKSCQQNIDGHTRCAIIESLTGIRE
jgi:MerR family transcriptional regulator, mercuric resistance operon regulatory protein